MEKLYENMIILENHLDAYEQKCQLYWNNIGRWQPKAKDFFKLAKAFKRLAYYKPQRLLDLEERARLGHIQSMMAAMAAQHAASTVLQSFAEGGIVKGSTTMGDKVLIRANAGEMLLNSKQQANLFNILNSGAVNSSNVELSVSSIKIKGSDLYIALSNHKKITHKTL